MKKLMIPLAALAVVCTVTAANAEWESWQDEDPMTGEVSKGLQSPPARPTTLLKGLYGGVESVIVLRCGAAGSAQVFNAPPRSGMSRVLRLRVRFDGETMREVDYEVLSGGPPGHHAVKTTDPWVKNMVLSKNEMLLEVPLFGAGKVIFKYDLTGSRAAYDRTCN